MDRRGYCALRSAPNGMGTRPDAPFSNPSVTGEKDLRHLVQERAGSFPCIPGDARHPGSGCLGGAEVVVGGTSPGSPAGGARKTEARDMRWIPTQATLL